MSLKMNVFINFLLKSIIINLIICQKLSAEYLENWGEKTISENNQQFSELLESIENYLVKEEGYSLDETDVIPFGFFKQTINGINYRLLCVIKKKSDVTPTIFDIIAHKHNDELKILSSKSLEDSSIEISAKNKKKMKDAIMKYYVKESYTVKEMEIEYEYHKL